METLEEKIAQLNEIIKDNDHIVFFGGAGVSTESGIPDFRSEDGLYHQKYKYPPETIVSHSFFVNQTEAFYEFYKDKMIALEAQPNAAHKKLAELEAAGKLTAVITQNIDGLHQKAGSKEVYELHGSVHRNYCQRCGAFYTAQDIVASDGVPYCKEPGCGGLIKPDVVLYEEGLDSTIISKSIKAISEANVLIIGGTSLAVYPAAGFIDYFQGEHLVVINKSQTQKSVRATLNISAPIGEVFAKINLTNI
jgi:NAD-dependent deacetylase